MSYMIKTASSKEPTPFYRKKGNDWEMVDITDFIPEGHKAFISYEITPYPVPLLICYFDITKAELDDEINTVDEFFKHKNKVFNRCEE